MKIRVRTVKLGDMAPRVFAVPEDIAAMKGPALDAWRARCVHEYRSDVLHTAADILHEDSDSSPVSSYISKAQKAQVAKGLVN